MPPARSAPPPHAPHPHAQQPADRAAIIATAFAFLVTMMGTTIPTPLHSISATELAFSPRTIPVLFAVYALGVVGALLAFGRLSDDLGRRPVLLIAVSFAFGSALLLLLPPSLPLLVAARVVSGLGAGLMSGAGTAAVIDLFPAQRRARGAAVAVAAHSGGLALGTLLAGTLASLAPHPLTLPVAVHLSLCVMAFLALGFWTPAPAHRGPVRIRPQRLRVPRELRGAFARAVLAAGAGFAITGVLTAVTALFLAQHLRLDNHALAGGIVFLAFAGMALGQLLAQRVRAGAAIPAGCAGLVLAAAALALALATATLAPLIIAAAVLGLSGGLCLNAGIASTVEQVPPAARGGVSSAFFAGLYLLLAAPAIGVGLLAAEVGLRNSGLVFSAAAALLAALVGGCAWLSARRSAA